MVATPAHLRRSAAALGNEEVLRIRNDFPILQQQVNGTPLVYLDSGGHLAEPAQRAGGRARLLRAAELRRAPRRAHPRRRGDRGVRKRPGNGRADFVGADADELVWTSNATEGLNLRRLRLPQRVPAGRRTRSGPVRASAPGDEIVVTEMEHHANLIPWQELAARTGATLRFIPVDDDGAPATWRPPPASSARAPASWRSPTCPTCSAPSTRWPTWSRWPGPSGALVVLDACQSAPHLPLDVQGARRRLRRVLRPQDARPHRHRRALRPRRSCSNAMPPFLTGGSMITTVTMERAGYLPPPQRFEAGTQRGVAGRSALAAAVNYLSAIGMDRIARLGGRTRPAPRATAWRRSPASACSGPAAGAGADRPRRHSTSRACTRTTSASSWTAAASPCASATTAPSRCTAGSG